MQRYTFLHYWQNFFLPYWKKCVILHPFSKAEIKPWWWNGRHGRLKICCRQRREGSSPSRGTKSADIQRSNFFPDLLAQNSRIFSNVLWLEVLQSEIFSHQKKFVPLQIENCFWVYRKEPGKPGEKVGFRRRKSTEQNCGFSPKLNKRGDAIAPPFVVYLNSATLWFKLIYKFLSNKKLPRILPCQIFHLS